MVPLKVKEKKEEQLISLGSQMAEGENVFVSAASLHPSVILCLRQRSFWQGNHLPSNWYYKNGGWPRWVLLSTIMWSPRIKPWGITALHIKSQDTGGDRTWTQNLVSPQSSCSLNDRGRGKIKAVIPTSSDSTGSRSVCDQDFSADFLLIASYKLF